MIALQIFFKVEENKSGEFETVFEKHYVPALQKQKGYIGSKLLKIYPRKVASEFHATSTIYNYQMELFFDNETNRRTWASGIDHQVVWGMVEAIFSKASWRGYEVVITDDFNKLLK